MIVVDTNVLSELVRARPDERAMAWFGSHDANDLWTTAITEAEMLMGLAVMQQGRRKADLQDAVDAVLRGFEHRILPFDRPAAQVLPAIATARRAARLPTDHADGQIAAIARANGAAVATRNVADFAHCGITVIDPWTMSP